MVTRIPWLYPSYEVVLRVHDEIVRRTGSKLGVVSSSNLAFVLETAKDIAEGLSEEKAVVRKAGYLLFNLINLHPFLDGNKRTAFEVTKNLLKLNGWTFEPGEADAFTTLMSIAKGTVDPESTERWIARNLSRGGSKA